MFNDAKGGRFILKLKVIISILLPIVILATALGINFSNFLMGWSATSLNLLATIGYWVTWVLLIVFFFKNQKVIKYYSIFWLATTISAFIAILYNIDIVPSWLDTFLLPLALLLLPQWYGISFITEDTLTSVVIIFFIALIMYFTTLFSYKKSQFKFKSLFN